MQWSDLVKLEGLHYEHEDFYMHLFLPALCRNVEFDVTACRFWDDTVEVFANNNLSFVGGTTELSVSINPSITSNASASLYYKFCYSFNLTVSGMIGCVHNGTSAEASYSWLQSGEVAVVASVYTTAEFDSDMGFLACGVVKLTIAGE